MGKLKNSITEGRGNIIGFLGEELIKKYLGIQDNNTYEYDLIYKNKKLEVKTKARTVEPRPFYNATVSSYNPNQKCDYYIFTSVLKDYSFGWICGFISKHDFFENAVFNKKGDYESNTFKFRSDCYNIQYDKLKDIDELI